MVVFGNIAWKLRKQNFVILAGQCYHQSNLN